MLTGPTMICDCQAPRRRGLTIVEMMISLVCVMLLMLAYTQLFSDVGTRVSDARSMIELDNRLRGAANRLRADLASVTCDMLPWQRPEAGMGYFEILEGVARDRNAPPVARDDPSTGTAQSPIDESLFLGDYDDSLMFTVRSKDAPFIGNFIDPNTGTKVIVQSEVAEVVWFMRPTMQQADGKTQVSPPTYTLYRRVFLVMPTYQGNPVSIPFANYGIDGDAKYDISVRKEGNNYIANTLGDLTKRECRIGHEYVKDRASANGFPHKVLGNLYLPFGGNFDTSGNYLIDPTSPRYVRYGEDVVLTNVVAFDVQVWDPTAPVYAVGNPPVAVAPGDPGFPFPPKSQTLPQRQLSDLAGSPQPISVGAYVDLNWLNIAWNGSVMSVPWTAPVGGPTVMSPFYSTGHPKSQLVAEFSPPPPNGPTAATFDTWSYHYEHDGLDQDSLLPPPLKDTKYGPDQGTNGFDDNGDGVVDDPGERETSPPYPVPLRGIRVRIRCYEPDSRQMREMSVTQSFVPE